MHYSSTGDPSGSTPSSRPPQAAVEDSLRSYNQGPYSFYGRYLVDVEAYVYMYYNSTWTSRFETQSCFDELGLDIIRTST